MDPKQQLNNLDPKLQEAYDRVMGANVPAPSPTQSTTPPQSTVPTPPPVAQPNPVPQAPAITPKNPNDLLDLNPTPTTTPTLSTSPDPAPIMQQPPVTTFISPAPTPTISATHSSSTFVASETKSQEKGKISPVILIAGIVVFFMVYTIFWIKFFNIPLPFLPQ